MKLEYNIDFNLSLMLPLDTGIINILNVHDIMLAQLMSIFFGRIVSP